MSDAAAPALEVLRRLDRLEGYLQSDPANGELLAEAFAAALSAGAWDRAEFLLRHAQALHLQPLVWSLHEAHWLLGQHRWPEARLVLLGLGAQVLPGSSEEATVAHDLAYIDWQTGGVGGGGRPPGGLCSSPPATPRRPTCRRCRRSGCDCSIARVSSSARWLGSAALRAPVGSTPAPPASPACSRSTMATSRPACAGPRAH